MVSNQPIQVGYRCGKLTVEAATEERKRGYTVWRCRCDCGGLVLLDTRALQRGTVRDCGCETVTRPGQRDLTGQRFGKLTCLYPVGVDEKYTSVVWRCRCDCGREIEVPRQLLTSGRTKSCGCLSQTEIKDYIGRRFGRLTVESYAGKEAGEHRWRCRCDCGNETVVTQTRLQSGKTSSCGCLLSERNREKLVLVDGTSVAALERSLNQRRSNNTSGYTGVSLNSRTGKWEAAITFKRRRYHLGAYSDLQTAVRARRRGEDMFRDFLGEYYDDETLFNKSRPIQGR